MKDGSAIRPTELSMPAVAYDSLKPGQKVKITQTVRVGLRSWPATVTGTVRDLQTLVTGLSTERARDDVVAIPTLHFIKENGELSSIAIDENTKIEVMD
jgi:hypothetical protein